VHSVGRLIASSCLSTSKLVIQLDSHLPYSCIALASLLGISSRCFVCWESR